MQDSAAVLDELGFTWSRLPSFQWKVGMIVYNPQSRRDEVIVSRFDSSNFHLASRDGGVVVAGTRWFLLMGCYPSLEREVNQGFLVSGLLHHFTHFSLLPMQDRSGYVLHLNGHDPIQRPTKIRALLAGWEQINVTPKLT